MTRRLGNLNEEKVAWYYKHKGYEVWMPPWADSRRRYATNQFRGNDIFGLFDLIAMGDDGVILAQVKTDSAFREKVWSTLKVVQKPASVAIEYWIFPPGGSDKCIKVKRYIEDWGVGLIQTYAVDPTSICKPSQYKADVYEAETKAV